MVPPWATHCKFVVILFPLTNIWPIPLLNVTVISYQLLVWITPEALEMVEYLFPVIELAQKK